MKRMRNCIGMALAMLLMLAGCAHADEAPQDIEYATLTVEKQTLADPEQWLADIAPDDAQIERTQAERGPDYQVTVLSGTGFCVEYDGSGSFSIEIDSDIPLRYRSEGEGENAPLPSELEGKYTVNEAEALARAFLEDTIGMDVSQLVLRSVSEEDPDKARSRAYIFEFGYQFDGINITRVPGITVAVNDDGVVQASAAAVYRFGPGEPVGTQALLTREQLRQALGQRTPMELLPVYAFVAEDDVRLAWLSTGYNDDGSVIWNAPEYDMRTGQQIAN